MGGYENGQVILVVHETKGKVGVTLVTLAGVARLELTGRREVGRKSLRTTLRNGGVGERTQEHVRPYMTELPTAKMSPALFFIRQSLIFNS